ncbi:restriction endonuclease [Streptomyces sp. NPDC050704]|uniref:restriction endonuclease n=1 Tax=Streptomyces sp. NPDC050704 TaxID=3157219 RepID=UPI003425704D
MRRRTRGRGRRQRRQADNQLVAVLAVAVVVIGLFVAVVNWLLAHWWVLIAVVVLAALAGGGWVYQRRQRARWEQVQARGLRYALPQLDALHHREFEHAVRELMRRDGCRDAERVGGGGDLGADVKATDPFGRRWVIQCKHRRGGDRGSAVGTPDLQVLNGTARPVHKADVVVLVTNGRISKPGQDFAKSQRLHLVDRRLLGTWAAGSQPLWDLLRAVPPPRRPSALS